jgi:hypothetical protein
MAELEIGVMSQQCLSRRIASTGKLCAILQAPSLAGLPVIRLTFGYVTNAVGIKPNSQARGPIQEHYGNNCYHNRQYGDYHNTQLEFQLHLSLPYKYKSNHFHS